MNELLFFGHILVVMGFLLGALRMGKHALVAFISLMAVLANLFVIKQMDFFSFTITCSDVFAVGAILGLNLLQEHYGKKEAKRAVNISFFALLFYVAMSQLHLFYEPSTFDTAQEAFATILKPAPRIVIASLIVFYIIQKFDVLLFGFLRKIFKERYLPIRMTISLLITQFLDTLLFSFAGLYGLVASIFDIVLISFLVKTAIILCSAPFVSLSKRFVKEETV